MTLACLITRAADDDPSGDALVGPTDHLTWEALERATAGVATLLIEAGVERGDRVAVGLPKDVHSYIAAHGALRAGAIVVPIDPLAPPLAARAVLADAEVSAFFGAARTLASIDPWTTNHAGLRLVAAVGAVDDPRVVSWGDLLDGTAADRLSRMAPRITPQDSAYIIYTSGSTGTPKGILHTHASAMAYAERAAAAHGLSKNDRVAGMSPLHFDMSTFELYAAPRAGAAVVVIDEAHLRFPASFTARCEEERVTVWYSVPSLFRQVVERGALAQRDLSALRLVMYGGETYSRAAIAELHAALPAVEVKNIYGPAEVNECTNHRIDDEPLGGRDYPIGRPWDGVELMVVDDRGAAVAAGEPGELWVSAPTVMAGYWRRPDLTERSLHARPDASAWYATGDVVVEDDDHRFWFKGRRDHQIKVRGIRIELEAVETVLNEAPEVLHAVVAPSGEPGDHSYLIGVVVLREGEVFDPVGLRKFCTDRLPSVAVPREIVERVELPATATGKIDRRRVREQVAASVGTTVDSNR